MGMYEQGDVVGDAIYRSECPQCGAVRVDSQMGLEETPENFTSALVEVFRELHRVLRDDGTAWLNLGDSYYNYRPGRGQSLTKQTVSSTNQDLPQECSRRGNKQEGLKEKDIIGIPWRVAFALQADGWYLRQDIIWNKPNPMPESVKDRCTKSHEYIFLLTKKSHYYFDNESIKESGLDVDKNKRSVWTVPVHPYKEAHFATFPTQLIEPCIKAGSPKGGNVIDPFGGAGTTGMVADRLGRNATLIELNPDYVNIINDRIVDDAGMFAEING
jgi:DNA modification methylase